MIKVNSRQLTFELPEIIFCCCCYYFSVAFLLMRQHTICSSPEVAYA